MKTPRQLGRLATVLCALTLSACGGGGSDTPSPSNGPDDGHITPASVHATSVGTPQGALASAVIGAAGGQLSTADGRLTVSVPAGAFSQDQTLAIQEISNQAHGGVGRAYRITPEGLHTTVPMTLRFHFSAGDVANTASAYLGVAYQDAQGLWHAIRSHTLDATNRTLTVQTTHFSDWSMFAGVQLRPPEATVHVGHTLSLQVMACEQVQEDGFVSILHKCQDWDPDDRTVFWSVNGTLGGGGQIGTVTGLNATDLRNDAVYTAPAHVPNGDSMVVAVSAELFNPQQPDEPTIIMVSNVTVEDDLARSCEWLRTAGDLEFDIAFTPANYQSSDGYARYTGQQSGHIKGRVTSQTQAPALGWWVSALGTMQGQVAIHDEYLNPALRTTIEGTGQPVVADGSPNPDSASSGVVLYVDYTACTYTFSAGYAVMATVTDTPLQSEGGPTVTTKPVRVGTLGFDKLPIYASYGVLRSIHVERTATVVPDIAPGSVGYAPQGYSGTIAPGSEVAVSWTIKPVQ